MNASFRSSCATFGVSLLLTTGFLLTGCTAAVTPAATSPAINVAGNWQLTAPANTEPLLPALSGAFSGNSTAISAVLHADKITACAMPSTVITITGKADANNLVTLAGPFNGGTLTVTGTLSADGTSLTNAGYNVTGGTCAFTAPATNVVAHLYQPITGNYSGSFSDASGQVITLNATLTQSPASDPNGNFTLSGTATFPANSCFNSPVTVSNTQVTGGSFTLTYADSSTGNSVTASGVFSQDGKNLTVNPWALAGPCGPDSGTGTLTHQ